MDELKTNARALLERAKPGFAPSSEQLERVRRRLSSEPPPPPPKAANWAWYAGAVVLAGLLAGGVAMVGTGAPTATADTTVPAASPPAVTPEPSETIGDRSPPPPPAPAQPTTPARASVVDEADDTAQPRQRPAKTRRPTPPSSPREASKPPAADTFAAQLELIIAARKALEAGSFSTARKKAQRYLDRFEGGSFDEEAQVLRLLASCGIERSDAVMSRARAYVKSHDSSFARRVRAACLEPSR